MLAALHDLSLAALFCEPVYMLAAGRMAAGGPPAAVLTAETIRRAYGADVLVIPHPDTGDAAPDPAPRQTRRRDRAAEP